MNDGYCNNCKRKVPVWIRSRDATIRYNNRAMNRSITDDQNYLAYVVGPIPLN